MQDPHTTRSTIARLSGLRVLVIGDLTLDEYFYGRPTRLSREAPVPVLEMERHETIPGAAANPACNIVALGSQVIQVGVVGDDPSGIHFKESLREVGIATEGILTVARRTTTTKTRIMAHEPPRLPQQLARLDRIDRSPLSPTDEQRILHTLTTHIPHVDVVLCSDYQIGLLTLTVVDHIRTLCRQHRVLLTVDAQGNAPYYHGVDLFRCNNVEASRTLGSDLIHEEDFREGLAHLQARLQAKLVIVTRGPEGVSLIGHQVAYTHLEARSLSEVYDTTGAGDTFIATVTLAMAAGLDPLSSTRIANIAASLVVQKFGNAVVSPEELAQAMP